MYSIKDSVKVYLTNAITFILFNVVDSFFLLLLLLLVHYFSAIIILVNIYFIFRTQRVILQLRTKLKQLFRKADIKKYVIVFGNLL